MIWSHPPHELRRNDEALRHGGRFEVTDFLEADFAKRNIPHAPVHYFVIPPISHKIDKLVVPYVALNAKGRLRDDVPSFYAVTKRPDDGDLDKAVIVKRSQEAHVVAEDLALRQGIFTPFARLSSEVLVSEMIPTAYRENYLQDRVVHLGSLAVEAKNYQESDIRARDQEILVEQLDLAITGLSNRIG